MKRGIAGSLVMTNFDRAALYDVIHAGDKGNMDLKYFKKTFDMPAGGKSVIAEDIGTSAKQNSNYPDQIPPFKISISAINEYGSAMQMGIFGVELLNQGQGISVDDMTTETQFTFVARGMVDWSPVQEAGTGAKMNNSETIESRIIKTQAYEAVNAFSGSGIA